jgi:hypothetical protein
MDVTWGPASEGAVGERFGPSECLEIELHRLIGDDFFPVGDHLQISLADMIADIDGITHYLHRESVWRFRTVEGPVCFTEEECVLLEELWRKEDLQDKCIDTGHGVVDFHNEPPCLRTQTASFDVLRVV